MVETIVRILLGLATLHVLTGVLFAAWYHARLTAIDPATRGAGIGFRLLVTPGVVALWPVLWRNVVRQRAGGSAFGSVHAPVTPERLRRLHGAMMLAVSVLVPVIAGAAIAMRPAPAHGGSWGGLGREPAPLPNVLREDKNAFHCFGAVLRIRGDSSGARQVEVAAAQDFGIPTLALYWNPDGADKPLAPGAHFLGFVWGPATRRFPLPSGAADGDGAFVLYSLAHGGEVLAADCEHE